MRELTITRALSELKLLTNRYDRAILECQPIAVKHGNRLSGKYKSYKPEDFKNQIRPSIQSIEKLENLIFEIKTKINISNSITKVKIGSQEMTVQEAIIKKNLIYLKKTRLNKFKEELRDARLLYEKAIDDNNTNIAKQVQDLCSKSTTGKVDPDAEKSIKEAVDTLYKVEFIDDGLEDKIKKLETEIEEFENNVDFALSESNSTTYIEISD